MKASISEKLYLNTIYLLVGLLTLVCIFPLIYVVGQSFLSEQELIERGNLVVVPYNPTLYGYKTILKGSDIYIQAFLVSVARVAIGTSLVLSCTLILGYLVSKRDLPGGKVLFGMVLFTVLYGGGLIPSYMTVYKAGLLDSFWALILPGLVDSWLVLVFRQFFSNLPKDILEAAEIDGCGEFRKLLKVVIPSSGPVIAAGGLFTAVGHWNGWFDALLYLPTNKDLYPFQLLMRNMLVSVDMVSKTGTEKNMDALLHMGGMATNGLRMVVVVIGTVPILCIYPFLQKYFTAGMYTGAVKE